MQMINRFFVLLLMVNLVACSSLHLSRPISSNAVTNDNVVFVDLSIAHYMGTPDRIKLQTLVATAHPKQEVKWYSSTTGERFEFTSFRIYVNAQGEGCRNYRIALNRGILENRTFNYTACRDNQGIWKITSA